MFTISCAFVASLMYSLIPVLMEILLVGVKSKYKLRLRILFVLIAATNIWATYQSNILLGAAAMSILVATVYFLPKLRGLERFRVLNALNFGVIVSDLDGTILDANLEACKLLSQDRGKFIGQTHKYAIGDVEELINNTWVLLSTRRFETALVTSVTDISEKKLAEASIPKESNMFKDAIKVLNAKVMCLKAICDEKYNVTDFEIVYASESLVQMTNMPLSGKLSSCDFFDLTNLLDACKNLAVFETTTTTLQKGPLQFKATINQFKLLTFCIVLENGIP